MSVWALAKQFRKQIINNEETHPCKDNKNEKTQKISSETEQNPKNLKKLEQCKKISKGKKLLSVGWDFKISLRYINGNETFDFHNITVRKIFDSIGLRGDAFKALLAENGYLLVAPDSHPKNLTYQNPSYINPIAYPIPNPPTSRETELKNKLDGVFLDSTKHTSNKANLETWYANSYTKLRNAAYTGDEEKLVLAADELRRVLKGAKLSDLSHANALIEFYVDIFHDRIESQKIKVEPLNEIQMAVN